MNRRIFDCFLFNAELDLLEFRLDLLDGVVDHHVVVEAPRTYSGAAAGKGAAYAWQGNNKVGEGRMEILDDPAPSKVVIKLDFIKPFEGHNTATFLLVPKGDVTDVTWTMDGPSPFVAKLMGVFMNMDKMIGNDFETGLANLKAAAEK